MSSGSNIGRYDVQSACKLDHDLQATISRQDSTAAPAVLAVLGGGSAANAVRQEAENTKSSVSSHPHTLRGVFNYIQPTGMAQKVVEQLQIWRFTLYEKLWRRQRAPPDGMGQPRRAIFCVVYSPLFQLVILLLVVVNCILLAQEDPMCKASITGSRP